MNRRGVIFDFDNTIANTDSTKAMRTGGRWKEAIIGTADYQVDSHIISIFNTLKSEGAQICIVSNAPETYCRTAMNRLGLEADYIIGYHDTPFAHKPESEPIDLALCLMGHPKQVIGIGDEKIDVIAYNKAGVRAINYLEHSGYYAENGVITNCKCTYELEEAVNNWLGIKPSATPKITEDRTKAVAGREAKIVTCASAVNEELEEAECLKRIEIKISRKIDALEALARKYENEMHDTMAVDYDAVDEKKYLADKKRRLFNEASKYELCKGSPYFGRMVVDEKELTSGYTNRNASYLIGKNTISTETDGILVHDWRTAVGNRFYQKSELDFQVNDFHYTLNLRRALHITNAVLVGCKTEYMRGSAPETEEKEESEPARKAVITDPFLLEVLTDKRRENRATDIISTIQEKQNEIIRSDEHENFIVQGCAGSGKTMILLHRLSYLLYNKKISTDKTVIITPSKHFNMAIDDLGRELEIGKIKKMSIRQYYIKLIKQYTSEDTKGLKVSRESGLDEGLLSEIYSNDFCSLVSNRYDEYWGAGIKILEENACKRLFDKFTTEDYQLKIDDTHLWKGKRYSSEDIDFTKLNGNSYSKMDNTIKQILNETSRMQTEFEQSPQRIREIDVQIKDIKWQLTHLDNIVKGSLHKRLKALTTKRKQLISREKELTVLLPSEEEKTALENCSKAIKKLSFDNVLNTVMKGLLSTVYEKHGVELTSKIYQHKLYLKLILCYRYYGELLHPDSFVNIDEAQDLSVCEYRLLKNILGKNAIFNLYGDIGQLIYEFKDIRDWRQLENVIAEKRYELSENYRNTLQITEYCNKFFSINLYPIGISGVDVIELNISDALDEVQNLRCMYPKYRIAIIAKNKAGNLKKKIGNILSHEEYSWMKVEDDKISVIPVEMAKGLEFNVVAVIADNMTAKELYIAYTRAMDNLIISS